MRQAKLHCSSGYCLFHIDAIARSSSVAVAAAASIAGRTCVAARAAVRDVVVELDAERTAARLVAVRAPPGVGRRSSRIGRVRSDAEAAIACAPGAAPKLGATALARVRRHGGGAAREAERSEEHGGDESTMIHRKLLEEWRSVSIPP
jgi:hypothetical protein